MNRPRVSHRVTTQLTCSLLVAAMLAMLTAAAAAQQGPRVFITDSESWEVVGSAAGSGGTFAASTRGGARPQTAEIIKTFGERCPGVVVNNRQEKADYVVVLDHEGGKGYLRRRNKVAVFNKAGDAIVSRSTRSLGNSVQDACNAIIANWSGHTDNPSSASRTNTVQPQPSSKDVPPGSPAIGATSETPSGTAPATGVTSASILPPAAMLDISSAPPDAEIEIDGGFGGNTPSSVGVSAGDHTVRITKKGYAPWERKIRISTGRVRVVAELDPATAATTIIQTKPAQEEQSPAPELPAPTSSAASLHSAVMTSVEPKPSTAVTEKPSNSRAPVNSATTTEEQGTASVTSNPEGAEIFVDSVGRGVAPTLLKLGPGKHTIQLVAKGYKDWTGEVEVKSGSIVNVTGTLEK